MWCVKILSFLAQQKEAKITDDIGWEFFATPSGDHKLSQQGIKGGLHSLSE